ncbi:hypothetical protein PoB_007168500 [Plakobranchus ocellatus]|uniref:Uncharacterized protein n=1 Tax=Plakobranchus ocellatus TaxID=259542 RepID=A0AAV4DMC2_9GAST|nr:hypothetical protein PoB_007168500 [Plakobranchus ocellatus]
MSGVVKNGDFMQMRNLIIRYRIYRSVHSDLEKFLKEVSPKSIAEVRHLADKYRAAHTGHPVEREAISARAAILHLVPPILLIFVHLVSTADDSKPNNSVRQSRSYTLSKCRSHSVSGVNDESRVQTFTIGFLGRKCKHACNVTNFKISNWKLNCLDPD